MTYNFTTPFPLNYTDSKGKEQNIGDVLVEYVGEFDPNCSKIERGRYGVDIDFVRFEGTDIKAFINAFAENLMDDIIEHALRDFRERVEMVEEIRQTA
jgi:hypothetical protein